MKEMTLSSHEVPAGKSEGATVVKSYPPPSPSPFTQSFTQGLAVSQPHSNLVLILCMCCRRWQFELRLVSVTCKVSGY